MKFKAVIPAAGEGRRLRPHTFAVPKVLVEVAGKPIIGHIMDRLLEAGPAEVVVVVGEQGAMVEEYLRRTYDCAFSFVEQTDPHGLGDAVYRARDRFDGEPAFVLLGDTIVDADMTELVGEHNVIGVKEVKNPRRFGIAEMEGERVKRLVEKPAEPASNLAVVGVYFLHDSRSLFECLQKLIQADRRTRGEFQLTDALQMMVESGKEIRTVRIEHWLDCGTPEALLATNRHLLARDGKYSPRKGCVLIPPLSIADSARIEHSVVGPNVSVGEHAAIRCSVVADSIIGRESEIAHSVLEKSLVGERSIVRERPWQLNIGGFSELSVD
ncbi:MAG: NTP transferase domain-containing protein [candidate division WOR-3 bacterium]|nr:MAG: NTP transferase domain-containing protein [candidate division WOR-3 bacterium]